MCVCVCVCVLAFVCVRGPSVYFALESHAVSWVCWSLGGFVLQKWRRGDCQDYEDKMTTR